MKCPKCHQHVCDCNPLATENAMLRAQVKELSEQLRIAKEPPKRNDDDLLRVVASQCGVNYSPI